MRKLPSLISPPVSPLKQKTFAVMLVEAEVTLRTDAELIKPTRGAVNPVLAEGIVVPDPPPDPMPPTSRWRWATS